MDYFFYKDRQRENPVSHCYDCGGEIYSMDNCTLNSGLIYCEMCAASRFDSDDIESINFTGYELSEYFKEIFGGGC